jgi:hypothetical protein
MCGREMVRWRKPQPFCSTHCQSLSDQIAEARHEALRAGLWSDAWFTTPSGRQVARCVEMFDDRGYVQVSSPRRLSKPKTYHLQRVGDLWVFNWREYYQ